MFAFNVTGEIDEMRRRHDLVAGARRHLRDGEPDRRRAHRAARAAAARGAADPRPPQRLGRADAAARRSASTTSPGRSSGGSPGADHMHVNGLRNKFCEPDESVIASARSLPDADVRGEALHRRCRSSPRASRRRRSADTYAALGSADLIYAAGGGIMGHPGGPAAGVAALREAWDAALAGVPAAEAARPRPALAAALGKLRMSSLPPTGRCSPGTATTSPARPR